MAKVNAADLVVGQIYRDTLSGVLFRITVNTPPCTKRVPTGIPFVWQTINVPRKTAGCYYNDKSGEYVWLEDFEDGELETVDQDRPHPVAPPVGEGTHGAGSDNTN